MLSISWRLFTLNLKIKAAGSSVATYCTAVSKHDDDDDDDDEDGGGGGGICRVQADCDRDGSDV